MTRGLSSACLVGLALLVFGCGSDDSGNSNAKPPTIAIVDVTTSEGTTTPNAMGEAELTLPCDGNLALTVTTENWSARAPGGCGKTQSCGHIEALATAENGTTSRARAVATPLLALGKDALSEWVGAGTIRARLVHDDDSPYLGATREEIATTVNVTFLAAVDCAGISGAPTGGAGGAASDGPNSGAGGAAN